MRVQLLAAVSVLALLASACGTQPVATSPTPTVTAPQPTATGSPADLDRAVVYLARDRMPPVAWPSTFAGQGSTAEDRIRSRIEALFTTTAPAQWEPPLANVVPLTSARLGSVVVSGDLATLDFTVPNEDWTLGGSAMLKAFVQQLVYTASEERGIRRVLITQNGGQTAIIGGEGLTVDRPTTREQIAGYPIRGEPGEVRSDGEIVDAEPLFGYSAEREGAGLVRLSVELRRSAGQGAWIPAFVAGVAANDEQAHPERGRWLLTLEIPGVRDDLNTGFVVGTQYRPLRWVQTVPTSVGTRYLVGLDELRPWRTAVLRDPVSVVVDFGGDPDVLAANTVAYAPRWGVAVERTFRVSGLARAFEATVLWRAKDFSGRVVASGHTTATLGTSVVWGAYAFDVVLPAATQGNVDVEVYQSSPKDGAETDLVRLPVARP